MFETLTGFKNICGKIPWLQKHGYTYILGYEESVGYSPAEPVRDKDGVAAAMLMTEAAAYYRKQGKTLLMVLEDLFRKYGYYHEEQVSLVLEGLEGKKRIARMMSYVRENLPKELAGLKVEQVIDFKDGYEDIPPSNVLKFTLEKNTWFAMRPSGTEPKIKFYFYTRGTSHEESQATLKALKDEVLGIVNSVA
jgi:phosphoglucomutase